MSGTIPPLPNTPSWRGAQLKHRGTFTFIFYWFWNEFSFRYGCFWWYCFSIRVLLCGAGGGCQFPLRCDGCTYMRVLSLYHCCSLVFIKITATDVAYYVLKLQRLQQHRVLRTTRVT
jgi:hypothetical protein